MRTLLAVLLLGVASLPAQTIREATTVLAASVAPQAKLEAPGRLAPGPDGEAVATVRAYHIVTPSAAARVRVWVRVADPTGAEAGWRVLSASNAEGRAGRLGTTWSEVLSSQPDAADCSVTLAFEAGGGEELRLEWRYEIANPGL